MKKQSQKQSEKKLSLKKVQLTKLGMASIQGGLGLTQEGGGDCMFPDNKSKPDDGGLKLPTQ